MLEKRTTDVTCNEQYKETETDTEINWMQHKLKREHKMRMQQKQKRNQCNGKRATEEKHGQNTHLHFFSDFAHVFLILFFCFGCRQRPRVDACRGRLRDAAALSSSRYRRCCQKAQPDSGAAASAKGPEL